MINSIYGKIFGKPVETSYALNPVPICVCKGGPGPQVSSSEDPMDAAELCEAHHPLKMKVGEVAKLSFQENITTGYTWVLLK